MKFFYANTMKTKELHVCSRSTSTINSIQQHLFFLIKDHLVYWEIRDKDNLSLNPDLFIFNLDYILSHTEHTKIKKSA